MPLSGPCITMLYFMLFSVRLYMIQLTCGSPTIRPAFLKALRWYDNFESEIPIISLITQTQKGLRIEKVKDLHSDQVRKGMVDLD